MTEEEAKALANDGRAKFRVWWIPQIPMTPFQFDVPDYRTGVLLTDALAKYDAFQFEHKVKPDYCNAGGVEFIHPVLTEDEWHGLDEDEAVDLGWAETPQ